MPWGVDALRGLPRLSSSPLRGGQRTRPTRPVMSEAPSSTLIRSAGYPQGQPPPHSPNLMDAHGIDTSAYTEVCITILCRYPACFHPYFPSYPLLKFSILFLMLT